MTTIHFITQLFCKVDDKLTKENKNQKHTKAKLYPAEVVTLALLFALKGMGNRPFYRWIENNYKSLFPNLPERTRLFRWGRLGTTIVQKPVYTMAVVSNI